MPDDRGYEVKVNALNHGVQFFNDAASKWASGMAQIANATLSGDAFGVLANKAEFAKVCNEAKLEAAVHLQSGAKTFIKSGVALGKVADHYGDAEQKSLDNLKALEKWLTPEVSMDGK